MPIHARQHLADGLRQFAGGSTRRARADFSAAAHPLGLAAAVSQRVPARTGLVRTGDARVPRRAHARLLGVSPAPPARTAESLHSGADRADRPAAAGDRLGGPGCGRRGSFPLRARPLGACGRPRCRSLAVRYRHRDAAGLSYGDHLSNAYRAHDQRLRAGTARAAAPVMDGTRRRHGRSARLRSVLPR